ncbi:MAG: PorT family protein [Bacteroidetes bacterium]|nr:PorT family protein [Bacteroidota bacterium]
MKKYILLLAVISFSNIWAQVEEKTEEEEVIIIEPNENDPDTIQFRVGKSKVIVINPKSDPKSTKPGVIDTIDAAPKKYRNSEAKWGGLEFGYNVNTNAAGGTSFQGYRYWENDPAKSVYFNLNIFEKKFDIIKEYVGITTGLGFNFNSFGLKNNYELVDTVNMVYGKIGNSEYTKNKLKASYVQVPLLVQFNTNADNEEGFYLAAGVIGGARMTSKLKRKGSIEGKEFEEKKKGTYGLNPFKLDATARIGYKNIGAFVNYSLMPLFETQKTVGVYPLTFGATFGF